MAIDEKELKVWLDEWQKVANQHSKPPYQDYEKYKNMDPWQQSPPRMANDWERYRDMYEQQIRKLEYENIRAQKQLEDEAHRRQADHMFELLSKVAERAGSIQAARKMIEYFRTISHASLIESAERLAHMAQDAFDLIKMETVMGGNEKASDPSRAYQAKASKP